MIFDFFDIFSKFDPHRQQKNTVFQKESLHTPKITPYVCFFFARERARANRENILLTNYASCYIIIGNKRQKMPERIA